MYAEACWRAAQNLKQKNFILRKHLYFFFFFFKEDLPWWCLCTLRLLACQARVTTASDLFVVLFCDVFQAPITLFVTSIFVFNKIFASFSFFLLFSFSFFSPQLPNC